MEDEYDESLSFSRQAQLMEDPISILAFKKAICNNADLFKNKVVLDIHCGTGSLSIFAAKAGAKQVIAIDDNHDMTNFAKNRLQQCRLSDIITFLEGDIELIELPPNIEQVDIIISAWMSFGLLLGDKLYEVIFARDRWLKPGGLMFPDRCTLYVAGIEDRQYIGDVMFWWRDVYDHQTTELTNTFVGKPFIDYVDPKQVVTTASMIKQLDLYTLTVEHYVITTPFTLKALKNEDINGLIFYFTVDFTNGKTPVLISTAPEAPLTYWRQSIFFLKNNVDLAKGERVKGTFKIIHNPNLDLYFVIEVKFENKFYKYVERNKYKMSLRF